MPWDPDRYHQFWKERSAPFEDLFAMIKVREGLRVVDLGCGTGELTRELAERLPGSDVLGIDVSPEMLARTKEHERPGLRFEHAAIESVEANGTSSSRMPPSSGWTTTGHSCLDCYPWCGRAGSLSSSSLQTTGTSRKHRSSRLPRISRSIRR